jgi:hypothetical protein
MVQKRNSRRRHRISRKSRRSSSRSRVRKSRSRRRSRRRGSRNKIRYSRRSLTNKKGGVGRTIDAHRGRARSEKARIDAPHANFKKKKDEKARMTALVQAARTAAEATPAPQVPVVTTDDLSLYEKAQKPIPYGGNAAAGTASAPGEGGGWDIDYLGHVISDSGERTLPLAWRADEFFAHVPGHAVRNHYEKLYHDYSTAADGITKTAAHAVARDYWNKQMRTMDSNRKKIWAAHQVYIASTNIPVEQDDPSSVSDLSSPQYPAP